MDWQYIHLNKGISDVVFLLVESIEFDKFTVYVVINYYYKLINEKRKCSYEEYLKDFRNALCIFPFFVCVWFNSEDNDKGTFNGNAVALLIISIVVASLIIGFCIWAIRRVLNGDNRRDNTVRNMNLKAKLITVLNALLHKSF